MRCTNLLVPGMALTACLGALAQTPTYNLGRAPSQAEIKAWDIAISPDGKELPPGSGTAQEGAKIYAQKCASCHGPTGAEGPSLPGVANLWPYSSSVPGYSPPSLVGGSKGDIRRLMSSPFATSLWDYINRAMPPKGERSLSADEVYALTGFLLYRNGVIQESDVLDAKSLPKIEMPNRNGFIPPPPGRYPGRP